MKIEGVLIGTDPELFIQDENGNVVSSIGIIPGEKHSPHLIDDEGRAIMIDCTAMEYTTLPAKSKEEFIGENKKMLAYIEQYLTKKNLKPLISSYEEFTDEQLNNPIAQTLGCEADYDLWKKSINEKPNVTGNGRSAAGHIHIGYDNPTVEISEELMRAFDLFVTVPSLLIDNNIKAVKRRSLYGKAGAARFQPHGLEARTLSNFWLTDENLMGWVYDQTMLAIDYVNRGGKPLSLDDELGKKIYETINTNSIKQAEEITAKFKIKLPVSIVETYEEV